jgi:molecular chaperone GrpE
LEVVVAKRKAIKIPVINRKKAQSDDEAEPTPNTVEEQGPIDEVAETEAEVEVEIAVNWYNRALQLQAEMVNYRRRQERLAETRVMEARADLLRDFLGVLDNIERIIEHLRPDDAYDQSVRSTYEQMLHILKTADVDATPALGEPFDPDWHEAVAMVAAPEEQDIDMLVVEVEQRGYRLGDQMLRPARVVVAKKSN